MSTYYPSDYLNAERAAAEYRDTRTADQRKWDDRSYAVSEIAAKMRALTYDRMSWSRDPRLLETMSNLASDLQREMAALRIEGYRPGDTVPRVEAPKPITTRPVGAEDRIIPLGKIGGEAA